MVPMKWKQFFTPVQSFTAADAKSFMDNMPGDAYTLLDVRQPEEYRDRHIPGAKLIPVTDIGARIDEIDSRKPVIVYCAIGGRSRIAAQMLAGKGFREVYNLSGGIKAWETDTAFGSDDLGMDLFDGNESPEETLVLAYSLEEGLREFYLSMMNRVKDEKTRQLFLKLSEIEIKHQDRIFDQFLVSSGKQTSRSDFEKKIVAPAMEGGLSTEDYLSRYPLDLEVATEVVSMAMAIEAQALDLYQRAADKASDHKSQSFLSQIADEERAHLRQLGELFSLEAK